MTFTVGDTVVYPHHGAATIEAIEKRVIKGVEKDYLVLRVAQGDLTVRVPADNVDLVGVRDVVNQEGLDRVFDVLSRATRPMLRQPHLTAAMLNSLNTADATAVAEVGHIDRQVRDMLLTICGVDDPEPQDISLMRLVQHTWHGILQSSLNGRIDADETENEIQLACRLILAPLSGSD